MAHPAIAPTGPIERWALLVGISKYAHERFRLRFAARDALKMREKLLEEGAGGFRDDHILLLVDEKATAANLAKGLRTFLKSPNPDDLVVLFFACHGTRDPQRPDNLYFLPHEADPADISGTGVPMRELEQALTETLHSRRVVVLVDTCHSGGVGWMFGGQRGAGDDAGDLNAYLGALSRSRGGVSVMTSAMAAESSVEGEQWGDGHGVFTHYLLQGLSGAADQGPPYDTIITVGELFDFVEAKVREATDDKQHPHISANADRGLPLAVTSSLTTQRHQQLAERLAESAELLGEPTCWRGAAVQYGEVMRLQRNSLAPDLGIRLALALYRSGDPKEAEKVTRALPPEAAGVRRTLGLLQLAQGRRDPARETLRSSESGEDWAQVLFSAQLSVRQRIALLIGLDVIDPAAYNGWDGRLYGPVAEVNALGDLLATEFDFDVVRLVNDQATAAAIRTSLADVVGRSGMCDSLVVFFSGHGGQIALENVAQPEGTWVAFDAQLQSSEIDGLLTGSATRTTLILAGGSGDFLRRAESGAYEVITASAPGQMTLDGNPMSAFMEAFLPNIKAGVTGKVVARATRRAVAIPEQDPQFVVASDRPLFVSEEAQGGSSSTATLLAQVLLGTTAAVSAEELDQIAELVAQGELPNDAAAPVALESWLRSDFARFRKLQWDPASGSVAMACAAASAAARGRSALGLADALERLGGATAVASDRAVRKDVRSLVTAAGGSHGPASRTHALLVGVSSVTDGRPGMKSASDSVRALRAVLLQGGIPASQVTALVDAEATGESVRTALGEAGTRGAEQPFLVYWCGPGSLTELLCFDGDVLDPSEIARLAGAHTTFIGEGIHAGAPRDPARASDLMPRLAVLPPSGASGRPAGTVWHPSPDGGKRKARYGRLTIALVEALQQVEELGDLRVSTLITSAGPPVVLAAPGQDLLLDDPLVSRVDDLIGRVRDATLMATTQHLERLLGQRNSVDAEAQLQRGILLAQIGKIDEAVAALQLAIQQFSADSRGEAQAHLHLGRVLLTSGQDRERAVSECRLATVQDPELAAAWFWLGRAITDLVQRESTAEASTALREYLARGAPLGRRDEVMKLLTVMQSKVTPSVQA